MSDVWFVKTRYQDIGYVPYQDWFKLAELSGYPTCYLDEMDVHDASKTYIITPLNGEWIGGWPDAKARVILWELEWRRDWRAEIDTPPGVAETWASDKAYAEKIGARYVILGSHADLAAPLIPKENAHLEEAWLQELPQYDIAFMAYLDPSRRKHLYNELTLTGLRFAPNGWNDQRHIALKRSRLMVHIHQWDNLPYIAPLRWCIAAAYSLPLISESVVDRGKFGYGHFMTADYDHLVPFTLQWLRPENANVLADYGRALHGFLCKENTFRKCVEAAL